MLSIVEPTLRPDLVINAHANHLRAAINRAFDQFPLSPKMRLKAITLAFHLAENAIRATVNLTEDERILLIRQEGEARRSNARDSHAGVIQSADTFIEVCRQAAERGKL